LKILKICCAILITGVSLGQGFEPKQNSGQNKLERINSIERHIVSVDKTIQDLKKLISDKPDLKGFKKLIEDLSKTQKSIKSDIDSLRTEELTQLKKDIEFIDQEKVEKLIDKFVKYQEDSDKRLKLLEESLKEINGQLKSVDSPIKK